MVELSVVIPVYRCQECLEALYERVSAALDQVTESSEIVFVDDRSPDDAWRVLCELAARDPRVKPIRLSRNFGQHAAITAGLAKSSGRWTMVTDCDLQDPPEEIPRLYAKAQEGFDVVLTRRAHARQNPIRRLASRTYFRLRRALMNLSIPNDHSTLSILSRKVVDAYLDLGDRDRQYMLILYWLGFERAVLTIQRSEREQGRSSYTLRKLIAVAFDGVFFQTTNLLRWIVYLGFAVAAAGGLLAATIVFFYFSSNPLPGWTSLIVLVLALGGVILVSLGVTGLYVGRTFEQVKGRPLYVIAEEAGASSDSRSVAEEHLAGALQPSAEAAEAGGGQLPAR